LDVVYDTDAGPLHTVRDVSLTIDQGEIFGLVGESGSGKTTLARAVVGYLPENGRVAGGRVTLDGQDLLSMSPTQMRKVWGTQITMVHQNPVAAVNPSIRIGEQIAEVARTRLGMSGAEADDKAVEMLGTVRIPDAADVARRYAHQLSGGMLQRVLIATALMTNPKLLIMDEPTTALDVTTQAVILDLVRDLLREYQTAVLYITHNLGVVARLADRVGVMYAGELVEQGPVREVYKRSRHPYTLGLLGCVPSVDADKRQIELHAIPGQIPRPDQLPEGCIFEPRCTMARSMCRRERPTLAEAVPGHWTACLRWEQVEEEMGTQHHRQRAGSAERDQREAGLVLEAEDVKKYFPLSAGGLRALLSGHRPMVKAVDGVSVRVRDGFTMGLVGESGCGKTTLARCIAGLEEATSGELRLEDEALPKSLMKRPKSLRRKIQMVFQSPESTLNPHHTVGSIVRRPLELSGALSAAEVSQRTRELFEAVNLPNEYQERLPHELSGGEKQRVAIARAFAAQPRLMLCDEPFSSLDVSVQASLMNLLVDLQVDRETAYLYVSHDLAAVRYVADWIAVVYLGRLCEVGSGEDVFAPPYHPYTEALLSSIPIPDPDVHQERIRLGGSVPSAVDVPPGCRFHTRCPRKKGQVCETDPPPWQEIGEYHRIRCHIAPDDLCAMQEEVLELSAG
jgi:peptide/nickel transport system ATP-binding protein